MSQSTEDVTRGLREVVGGGVFARGVAARAVVARRAAARCIAGHHPSILRPLPGAGPTAAGGVDECRVWTRTQRGREPSVDANPAWTRTPRGSTAISPVLPRSLRPSAVGRRAPPEGTSRCTVRIVCSASRRRRALSGSHTARRPAAATPGHAWHGRCSRACGTSSPSAGGALRRWAEQALRAPMSLPRPAAHADRALGPGPSSPLVRAISSPVGLPGNLEVKSAVQTHRSTPP